MQKPLYFIDVILPIPLERLFTYSVTKAEYEFLEKGMRVAVPFGKSKIYTALAYKIHNNPPTAYEAKTIHQILSEQWRDWPSPYFVADGFESRLVLST